MNDTTKKETKLKVDFNLLMSGTWVLDNRGRQKIHCFEKEVNGGKVVIYNALDVPSPIDSKMLDYLMKIAQESDWPKEITISSVSQIIKDLGLGKNKKTVDRIRKSIAILANTHVEFHNCFIDTGVLEHFSGYNQLVSIPIVSEYAFTPKRKGRLGRGNPLQVKVIFSDSFLTLCKHSLGYKLISYTPIRGLRDTAYAIYKWAYRWYDSSKGHGERWIGNGQSLVKWYKNELNSTAHYKYPSDVLRVVNSAIKQLNDEKSKVPFSFELKQQNGKYKMVMRAKGCVIKTKQSPYDSLPEPDRNALLSYVKDNRKGIKNPYGFLKSLSNKELDVFMRRVNGKKVLVSASNRMEEEPKEQSLRDRLSKVLKAHGVDDFDFLDNDDSFSIYPGDTSFGKIKKLKTDRKLMDTLAKIVGKPVRIA